MKIVFIVPGTGDSFYCGNCFRDNLQASALRKQGHDVMVIPLYLPVNNKAFKTNSPVFFPATSFYLAQKFFQRIKMPLWLERMLSSGSMLKMAASLSGTTSADGMEGMTLAMINGDDKVFLAEVERLVSWLKEDEQPDIIHLSSTLLIGIAKVLKEKLEIPVVCSVQDEEVWLDSMKEKYANDAWYSIEVNLQYVDKLITTSNFYKNVLQQRLPNSKEPEVIYPGIDQTDYKQVNRPTDPVIGFFYRMNHLNGLDILAKAFLILKEKNNILQLKLKIGGGYTNADIKFIKKLKKMLEPYQSDVEFVDDYAISDHASFYDAVSLISVPLTFDEGVGLYLCEAFAAGIPAVVPDTGSFSEIVDGAGILYQPNTPEKLAEALEVLLSDKERYQGASIKARQHAEKKYKDTVLADKLNEVYHACIWQKHTRPGNTF
ncbi:glycosyltransferase family 4 protein [Carboxylicivirga marina]|uniref:Glycosyltransferase family 4 protein n=1 Tax=Carboxylicivirga marina TaxID=2800988 RepID=A0ABS1HHL2_9BACT|nr:glycosyltransferase family 4 protein [Carboxylicivirga marina]MBK3517124.1 glycosyltransferase family 4 protein [Carboxylicivirga marina]